MTDLTADDWGLIRATAAEHTRGRLNDAVMSFDDMVQEAALGVWRALASTSLDDRPGARATFVATVARRRCADYRRVACGAVGFSRRRRRWTTRLVSDTAGDEVADRSAEAAIDAVVAELAVAQVLASIRDRRLAGVVWSLYCGVPAHTVGERLGISEGRVSQLRRAAAPYASQVA